MASTRCLGEAQIVIQDTLSVLDFTGGKELALIMSYRWKLTEFGTVSDQTDC